MSEQSCRLSNDMNRPSKQILIKFENPVILENNYSF